MRVEIEVQGPYILIIPDIGLDDRQVKGIMDAFTEKKILVLPQGFVESREVNLGEKK